MEVLVDANKFEMNLCELMKMEAEITLGSASCQTKISKNKFFARNYHYFMVLLGEVTSSHFWSHPGLLSLVIFSL